MKYYIKKYQTPAGPIENTYWSDVKIEGLTPLKIEKIDTGQTKKVKVGRKQQYLQKDGSWSDVVNENTINGQSTFNYGKGVTYRWEDVYEDQPIYKGRYLYKKEDIKPKPSAAKTSKSVQVSRTSIPDQYKEGLAEIKDGITYYTFPKYTNEQVTQAIQELFGNNVPTQKQLYKDYKPEYKENFIQQSAASNQQNSKSLNQKAQQKKTSVKNNNDSLIDKIENIFSFSKPENKTQAAIIQDPELTEYYAYPYKVDQFYSISPEAYSQVLSYLESKYGKSGNKPKEYIFTKKPLTYYKPKETVIDTIYTFVNSGGVEHYPLTRSTLDYKKDRISQPYNINKGILAKLGFSEYIAKAKDNKVKIPFRFSIDTNYPDYQVASPDSFYNMDYENMDQNEKEKFKQYLKNMWPDINFDEGNYDPFDYFRFKLTDAQDKKINQILDENRKRRKKFEF